MPRRGRRPLGSRLELEDLLPQLPLLLLPLIVLLQEPLQYWLRLLRLLLLA